MKKLTRLFALLLAVCLMTAAAPLALAEDVYTVTMVFIGNTQDDEAKIEAALNELMRPAIGVEVDLLVLPYGSFAEQLRTMLFGGEKLDLMLSGQASASTYVGARAVTDLSALIDEYGVNVKRILGDGAKVANINGYVYGIPTMCDWYREMSLLARTDWLVESGMKAEDIKTMEDVEKLFTIVKANHPEAAMMFMGKGQNKDSDIRCVDPLWDFYGVLDHYGAEPTVVNYFETDGYREMIKRHFDWAQKGWISPDAPIVTDTAADWVSSGKAFCTSYSTNTPAMQVEVSQGFGLDMTVLPLGQAYRTSTFSTSFYWSVATTSRNPVKAFQCLDFIFGSEEAATLLSWGIENEHYRVQEDGTINYLEGEDKKTCRYNANFGFQLPNQFVAKVWNGMPADVWTKTLEKNESALYSCAYGFNYDGTALTNEIAQLNSVCSEYVDVLNCGAADPDTVLPQFLEALKAAGIDKVIAEKQRQLDAWLKTK